MNETDFQDFWGDNALNQTFWQDLFNWVDSYFQQNVGVTLMDGLTAGEEGTVNAWASNLDNVYDYAQALYSQSFFQEYLASLPDYDPDDSWEPGDNDVAFGELFSDDALQGDVGLDALFASLFEGSDDDLFDDTPDGGPPFQPRLDRGQIEDMSLLYQAALDRKPDGPGLNYFVGNLRDGQSLQEIARSFYQAEEFRSQFDEFDDASYVNQLYLNVLDREADQSGIDYWLDDIQNNGRSHADVLVSFAQSDENRDSAAPWLAGLQFDTQTDEWIL